MRVWDWPNQQVVRTDSSGPGLDTPPPDAQVFWVHGEGGPDTFTFTTTEQRNSHTVTWDFGDGSPHTRRPTGESVEHTYDADGTYTVMALCHQVADRAAVTTGYVVGCSGSGLTYEFVLYTATWSAMVEGKTVDWDFGDGSQLAGADSAQGQIHTYDEAGDYTVTATIDGATTTTRVVAGEA